MTNIYKQTTISYNSIKHLKYLDNYEKAKESS